MKKKNLKISIISKKFRVCVRKQLLEFADNFKNINNKSWLWGKTAFIISGLKLLNKLCLVDWFYVFNIGLKQLIADGLRFIAKGSCRHGIIILIFHRNDDFLA